MSFSITFGNFLYKRAFPLYKPLYALFKKNQDAFEISLLKKYIKPGSTVLDIGANIGFYATMLSELAGPRGKVICFEPDPKNFGHLKRNTASLRNTIIHNHAVASKSGPITIYTSKNLNVDHRTYKPEEYDEEIQGHAISIDDYLQSNVHIGIQKIDFIKIDIQGFEMEALQGMERTLNQFKDIMIFSEFWPYGLHKAGSTVTEYFKLLTAKGFTCYLLEKNAMQKLSIEKVRSMEKLGEEHYFNILVSRSDV